MPTLTDLATALQNAKAAAVTWLKANPEGPNWYPCGFAYLTYKCRKNAKEAATLKHHGFSWNDYHKQYERTAYDMTNTQSMDYKESLLRVMADSLRNEGFAFNVRTYID